MRRLVASSTRQELEQAPGGGEGRGSPACGSPRDHEGLDTTERLNKITRGGWPAPAAQGQ